MFENPQFEPQLSSREEYVASLQQHIEAADQAAARREMLFTFGSKLLLTLFLCVLAITVIHYLIPVKQR